MRAQAKAAQGQAATLPQGEIEKFHSYQRWLATKESRVVILFASTLAEMIPAKAVRARRDFRQLLTLICTLGLMAQRSRALTEDGAIAATIDDYGRARRIMAPLFDSVNTDGITPAIRETVEAVKEGEVSVGDLAHSLDLAKSSISYRVRGAVRGGWLKNLETRRGYPARLVRGDPLPEARSALPTVEELAKAIEASRGDSNGCSNTDGPLVREGADEQAFECSNESQGADRDDVGIEIYPDDEGTDEKERDS